MVFPVCRTLSDMETFHHKSNSQGNLHSHSHHMISGSSSIVKRLASQSLTGRGLSTRVHQHYGFKLHLVWKSTRNCVTSETCLERCFYKYADVEKFCNELNDWCVGRTVWLRVSTGYRLLREKKAEPCYREPILQSQKYLNASCAFIRLEQEWEDLIVDVLYHPRTQSCRDNYLSVTLQDHESSSICGVIS